MALVACGLGGGGGTGGGGLGGGDGGVGGGDGGAAVIGGSLGCHTCVSEAQVHASVLKHRNSRAQNVNLC